MKGDFTRFSFKPDRHYSSVRMQQGRILLDSDWNEQVDIQRHLHASTRFDAVGLEGAPEGRPGLGITSTDDGLSASPGVYYLDGLLVENPAVMPLHDQWDRGPYPLPTGTSTTTYLAVLEAWERHVDALEEPDIREEALGGTDTCTRTRTAWQVLLVEQNGYYEPREISVARLSATVVPANADAQQPLLPSSGYASLDNRLYRVEVHAPGDVTVPLEGNPPGAPVPTVKWSLDNASTAVRVTGISIPVANDENRCRVVSVSGMTPAQVDRFRAAGFVEITTLRREFNGHHAGPTDLHAIGRLVRIDNVLDDEIKVHWDEGEPGLDGQEFLDELSDTDSGEVVIARAWDGVAPMEVTSGGLHLGFGVTVKFDGGMARHGDYWTIPARSIVSDDASRTGTGKVLWPVEEDGDRDPLLVLPHGVRRHYAALARVQRAADGTWTVLEDLRRFFPALSDMTTLHYVGGDGQMYHTAAPGEDLSTPLMVGVGRGDWRVKDALVMYEVRPAAPASRPTTIGPIDSGFFEGVSDLDAVWANPGGTQVVLRTMTASTPEMDFLNGVAACQVHAGDETEIHVVARLVTHEPPAEPDGDPTFTPRGLPIVFSLRAWPPS